MKQRHHYHVFFRMIIYYFLICCLLSPAHGFEKKGYFDFDYILTQSEPGKIVTSRLKQMYEERRDRIVQMEADLQQRKTSLKEKKNSNTPETNLKQLESDYMDRFKNYQGYVKQANEELAAAKKQSLDELKNKINIAAATIRIERNYSSIVEKKESTSGDDLTNTVIAEVNRNEHKPKKTIFKAPSYILRNSVDYESVRQIPQFNSGIKSCDFAIVIGIEEYQNVSRSEYSASDAALIKDYFKALGFPERNIEYLTGPRATKTSIERAIEGWLPNRVKKESTVIIYYSGHGAPDPTTGDSYILPYDGDPNYISLTGYSLNKLYEKLGRTKCKRIIVVLDSCFSGAGGRSVIAMNSRPLVMTSSTPALSSNLIVLTASQISQISTSSDEKGHGVFTYYFLKALKNGKKNLADIYEYLKPLVEDEAKSLNVNQIPYISPDAEKLKNISLY